VSVRTNREISPGRTLDISESGMAAILSVELQEGEEVELQIRFPGNTVTVRAVVQYHNVFRHGFEFVQPVPELGPGMHI
jgi:PilZ domain